MILRSLMRSSLYRTWEDVDHDLEESIAGELTKSGPGDNSAEVADPLGLGRYECVIRP
jgi:hypothetical protein